MDKIHLARLKHGNEEFEIIVDPDKAMEFKEGKASIDEVLLTAKIFYDAKKGLLASEEKLKSIFGTSDPYEIAKEIINKGEVQLSARYREKKREEIKRKIIEFIRANAIDPTTELPHPPQRIESALEDGKVKIDENKTVNEQIDQIIKKLKPIIPIKIVKKNIVIRIPSEYTKHYGQFIKLGKKLSEDWASDGNLVLTLEIPGGLEVEVYEAINKLTHGNAEIKVSEIKE